jgi:hypothetical protein
MGIYQYGQVNNTALSVPGVYIEIVPPQVANLNGVPSNVGGFVGTASWGPINAPTSFTDAGGAARAFGPMINRSYDLTTAASIATMQGAAGTYVGVRVTDGTDTKASGTLSAHGNSTFWGVIAAAINNGSNVNRGPSDLITATAGSSSLALTAKYSGSFGANISVSLAKGSKAASYKVIVSAPGRVPEVFDNLAAGVGGAVAATGGIAFTVNPGDGKKITLNGTEVVFASSATAGQVQIGADLATTLASALTLLRASTDTQLVKFAYSLSGHTLLLEAVTGGTSGNSLTTTTDVVGATASGATLAGGAASMTAPTLATASLSGGTDGASGVDAADLLGDDTTTPRTGMYALRKKGCSAACLVDCHDSTTVTAQLAFGVEEGCLMYTCGPSGDTITNAVSVKDNAGIDSYAVVYAFGDWPTFNDGTNKIQRKVSPLAFLVGRRVNLSPNESALNKPVFGVVSTEKSAANLVYSDGDISELYRAGFEVITNTCPGGSYFGCATGRNSSSDEATHNDSYSTMTTYIARTLNAGMGRFIGRLQSRRNDDPLRRDVKSTIDAFFSTMADTKPTPMIDDFQSIVDKSNNSDATIGGGYLFVALKVVFMSITEFFVATVEGGQTVVINRQGTFSSDQIGTSSYNAVAAQYA